MFTENPFSRRIAAKMAIPSRTCPLPFDSTKRKSINIKRELTLLKLLLDAKIFSYANYIPLPIHKTLFSLAAALPSTPIILNTESKKFFSWLSRRQN